MEQTTQSGIREAARLILAGNDLMILSHIRPDGDTLGCAFALKEGLEQLHKRAFVANSMEITRRYLFLSGGVSHLETPFPPQLVVSTDVATPALLGRYEQTAVDIVLDHHVSNPRFGRLCNVVASECAACGELIYQLLVEMGVEITESIAKALYTALSSDTGCFKFSNTTAQTHEIAGKLMRVCSMEQINSRLFLTKSKKELLIQKEALGNLEFFEEGRVALMSITTEMRTRLQAGEDDVDGMSNLPRSVEGVWAGVTLKQLGETEFKISLRTNGKTDAGRICAVFGGGGHPAAAGCTILGTLEEVKQRITEAAIAECRRNERSGAQDPVGS